MFLQFIFIHVIVRIRTILTMPRVNVFHLVFFHLLLPIFAVAQTRNISQGDSLTADKAAAPWLSNSGDFAFGFHQLDNKDHFLLAIWFNKLSDKTVVWYANGDNPAPRGSIVELTSNGRGLALNNPQGEVIWRSQFTGCSCLRHTERYRQPRAFR